MTRPPPPQVGAKSTTTRNHSSTPVWEWYLDRNQTNLKTKKTNILFLKILQTFF